jgi:hypothetical protein
MISKERKISKFKTTVGFSFKMILQCTSFFVIMGYVSIWQGVSHDTTPLNLKGMFCYEKVPHITSSDADSADAGSADPPLLLG